MDRATLIKAMGNEVISEAETKAVNEALVRAECTTVNRAAMFLAQIGHESIGMRYYSEIWGPNAQQLTYQGRMGNNNPGDGYRYRGSGPLQITGKDNFRSLSQWAHGKGYVPTPTYFVDNPDLLRSEGYGFLGAVWYWTVARQMNRYADSADIYGATVAVNGGTYGLPDRTERWNRCRALGNAILPTTKEEFLMSLDNSQQDVVFRAAVQTGDAQVSDPGKGVIGPRPQRHTQYYNVDGNPTLAKAGKKLAYLRAMVMDLWNDLVFDGYVAEVEDPALDSGRYGSLVGFVIATHKNARETRLLTQAIAEKVGVDTASVLAPKTEESK